MFFSKQFFSLHYFRSSVKYPIGYDDKTPPENLIETGVRFSGDSYHRFEFQVSATQLNDAKQMGWEFRCASDDFIHTVYVNEYQIPDPASFFPHEVCFSLLLFVFVEKKF